MTSATVKSVVAVVALCAALVACGSDDDTVEVPEGGTGSAYNDAIRGADSHDEVVFAEGGDMVVAVDCESDAGGTIVTVVGEGIEPGVYSGVFEPSTGVDLSLEVSGASEAVGAAQMTLDQAEYTVTFVDIDGAEFTVSGCPS